MFAREDWTLFRSVATLAQKAGVPQHHLRRLVAKELVDNALDAAGVSQVRSAVLDDATILVEDDGPGIPGTPAEVAHLFSVRRPLTSSKLLRLPTRGALGNGLRVVAGAVLASGGRLTVWTRDQCLELTPRDTGDTAVVATSRDSLGGARVEVWLGPAVPPDDDPLAWARIALDLWRGGEEYKGKPSPHWFDDDSFYELCQAAGHESARALVARLDGCTGARAGEIATGLQNRAAADLTRDEAAVLLARARAVSKPVNPKRLGGIGRMEGLPEGYAHVEATVSLVPGHGGTAATIPVMIEAWAEVLPEYSTDYIDVCVNRTPVTEPVTVRPLPGQRSLGVFGCGLHHVLPVKRGHSYRLLLNVQAPYLPLTSDGKAPDLTVVVEEGISALAQAVQRAKTRTGAPRGLTLKAAAWQVIEEAYAHASDNNRLPAKARQVGYAARERVLHLTGGTCWKDMDYFTQTLLPDFVAAHEDLTKAWDVVYDDRGHLTEPHTGRSLGIGTIAVRNYVRRWTDGQLPMDLDTTTALDYLLHVPTRGPEHRFGAALLVEKEGFDELWRTVRLSERYDLAIASTKGMSPTAMRQLVEAFTQAGITTYVLHDFDKSGFSILSTLCSDTRRYQFEQLPLVVDLGLRLEDIHALGLRGEPVVYDAKKDPRINLRESGATQAEAQYLVRGRNADGKWHGERVELNALTSRQLVTWVEEKLQAVGVRKVVPPESVLVDAYQRARRVMRIKRALDEAVRQAINLDDDAAVPENLAAQIEEAIDGTEEAWDVALARVVAEAEDEETSDDA